MTDNAKKVSELPNANTVAASDKILVLYNANTSAPSARTISVTNFLNSNTIPGPYTNDSAANTAGIVLYGLYYDTNGFVKVRIT